MISGIGTVCALETIGESKKYDKQKFEVERKKDVLCNIIVFLNEIHAGLPVQRSSGLDASRAIPQGVFFAVMIIRAIIDLNLLFDDLALLLFLSGLGTAQLDYFYACSA